jgi:acyl-CoA reductase-like NAD-dependent aldehyde dehydrogenase
VKSLRRSLVGASERLCAAMKQDLGKTPGEVLAGEILPLADACRFLQSQAAHLLGPRRVPRSQRPLWLMGTADTVHRHPRGVIGIIGTWNYPVFLNGVQILHALTAGNAVVWKPSEVAPATAVVIEELVREAGVPNDLLQVLEPTREAGAALVEANIDHVVFTGSSTTGRRIAARLGERLISSTMELSGCDAQFVFDDADVSLAAQAAWFGATVNRGQTCIAVRRALVQRPVYSAFCDHLRNLATPAGPLTLALQSQVAQADRLVREAVEQGGQLLVPANGDAGGDACRPAVVVNANPDMALCREAAFAPVLAVVPFDSLDEALQMEARCSYALAASIFTRDTRRAQLLAAQLRAGMVTINDVIVPTAHPATPFGGHGESGWGVTQGGEGLLEMTVPQVVSVRSGTYRPHFDLAAGKNAPGQEELARALLQSAHAPTFGQRLRGWSRLLRALWRGA